MSRERSDVAVITVSANDAHWLERCLSTVFDHAGDASLEAIVVDNASTDGTRELVESTFPQVRVVTCPNRGFAYGNNRGIEHADARYLLLLNPDTEVIEGTFGDLVRLLDARPQVGLAGVRQLRGDGSLSPTIRRFPSATRALGEALFSERWPVHPAWAGERVLEPERYERETECDWTSGSFMFARREALLSSGLLDERFFLYSEEPDLCLRIKRAGWQVRHMPQMTIVHHAGKGGIRPRMLAQDAYTRRQYARKHFSPACRHLYLAACGLRYAIRAAGARSGQDAAARREGAWRALRALADRGEPPFGPPPPTAVTTAAQATPDSTTIDTPTTDTPTTADILATADTPTTADTLVTAGTPTTTDTTTDTPATTTARSAGNGSFLLTTCPPGARTIREEARRRDRQPDDGGGDSRRAA